MSATEDTHHPEVIDLAAELIRRPSVTPDDAGCQQLIAELLDRVGFASRTLKFDDVTNLWSRRGDSGPLLMFAGHTDVVPTGPESDWTRPPFSADIDDGVLHGRGASDMKGSLAAMVTAVTRFVEEQPDHDGSIAFLLTSDEEGPAVNGTVRVIETLYQEGIRPDYCVVGEPTAQECTGDMIKVGRRGSLSANIKVVGKQGHVAYPHLAHNPVTDAARLIDALDQAHWDEGNEFFPPTTFQVSNIHAGTGAGNVIPGHVDILSNFRFSPASGPDTLKSRLEELCARHCQAYAVEWTLYGMPFQTPDAELLAAARESVMRATGIEPVCSTTGGTSDGRFIAPYGVQVVEIGPNNRTIHKIDEQIPVDDLIKLEQVYLELMRSLLTGT